LVVESKKEEEGGAVYKAERKYPQPHEKKIICKGIGLFAGDGKGTMAIKEFKS